VGRLIAVTTDGKPRKDVDPVQLRWAGVQLRWAGVPRSRAFDPIDLRRGQREYLNVLLLPRDADWRLVTFEDPDFDPGFTTELLRGPRHQIQVSVFATNTPTTTSSLLAQVHTNGDDLRLQIA
jgi:hypothetical protein